MDDPMTSPCLPGHLPEDPVHLLSLLSYWKHCWRYTRFSSNARELPGFASVWHLLRIHHSISHTPDKDQPLLATTICQQHREIACIPDEFWQRHHGVCGSACQVCGRQLHPPLNSRHDGPAHAHCTLYVWLCCVAVHPQLVMAYERIMCCPPDQALQSIMHRSQGQLLQQGFTENPCSHTQTDRGTNMHRHASTSAYECLAKLQVILFDVVQHKINN